MLAAAQSPHHHLMIHGRKPLQPKNQPPAAATTNNYSTSTKPKPNPNRLLDEYYSNKENVPPPPIYYSTPVKKEIESFDASLAEELTAIREKLERLRMDKEKTENMLRERGLMLDLQMEEIVNRGEMQKDLEIEVDRLYRLNEIRLAACSLRISPLRSLRDKEQEKKIKQDQLKAMIKIEDKDETSPSKPPSEFDQK